MRVIVRSNDREESYWIGTYKGCDPTVQNIPVVVDDHGEDHYVMGIIIPYSEPMAQMLDGLTNGEQWETLVVVKKFWRELATSVSGNNMTHRI